MAGILESLTHKLNITHYDDWVIFVEGLNEARCPRFAPVLWALTWAFLYLKGKRE